MPKGGRPTADHPRRCRAKRHDGERCWNYAHRGSNYCRFHGGKRALKHRVTLRDLPMFYSRRLGPTLTARLEELAGTAPTEQLSLFKELALMRVLAGDTLVLYDAAVEKGDAAIIANAGMLLRDAVKHVADICDKAARVDAMAKDKVSIHHLAFISNQIVRIAYEVFGDDIARAKQFEDLVKERIRLPAIEQGTLLTPDLDVSDMDACIPKE